MKCPKFTPGPWRILFNDKTKVVLEQQGVAVFVADTYAGFTKSEEEQKANAALIAAAPEMYALLQKIVEIAGEAAETGYTTVTGDRILEQGKAILQKARGEK